MSAIPSCWKLTRLSIICRTMPWICLVLGSLFAAESPAVAQTTDPVTIESLTGLVRIAGTDNPVVGAKVYLINSMMATVAPRITTTGIDGSFKFETLAIGHYVLEVGAQGYHGTRLEFDLPLSQAGPILIDLKPIVAGTGEVWGTVTRTGTNTPIAKAFVFIRNDMLARPDNGGEPLVSTYTNEEGRYVLQNVPIGSREVVVQHPDYEPKARLVEIHEGLISLANFDLAPRGTVEPGTIAGIVNDAVTGAPIKGASIQIDGYATLLPILTTEFGKFSISGIAPGSYLVHVSREGYTPAQLQVEVRSNETSRADFALKPSTPPASGVIEGMIYDAVTSQPLVGATIFYRDDLIAAADGSGVASAALVQPYVITDSRGHYRIGNLHPGTWNLYVAFEGYYGQNGLVEVLSGKAAQASFALKPKVPLDAGAITGQVFDSATGKAIAGALVYYGYALEDARLEWIENPALELPHVTTDEQGGYKIPDLQPGKYYLVVRAEAYEPGRDVAEVPSGGAATVNFELLPFVPLAPGSIAGQVIDNSTGQPLAGAVIHYAPSMPGTKAVWPGQLDLTTDILPQVRTDEQGHYTITDLRPGFYHLLAYAEGYLKAELDVEVISGQAAEANFKLTPYTPPTMGAITGRVVESVAFSPLAGATVYYGSLSPGGMLPPWVLNIGTPGTIFVALSVQTNEAGEYKIPDLPAGEYVVMASCANYTPQNKIVTVKAGAVTREINFALALKDTANTGVIEGEVVEDSSGAPIAGAWVFFGAETATGALPAWSQSADAEIPHVRTDERGHYRIGSLPPGPYHLLVRAEGYSPAHGEASVAAGQAAHANFRLIPLTTLKPGAITGQILNDQTGNPVAGAWIYYGQLNATDGTSQWWQKIEPPVQRVLTDDQGKFTIKELKPGLWYLLVRAEGYQEQKLSVEVKEDLVTETNVRLVPIIPPQPGAIEGGVVDAKTQQAIVGARVTYLLLPEVIALDERASAGSVAGTAILPEPLFVLTNETGHYRIGDLAPGKYHLFVTAEGYRAKGGEALVLSGGVAHVDFALEPAVFGVGVVAGKIIDALTTKPLPGVNVWVVPDGELTIMGVAPTVVYGQAITDENGEYRMENIPAGEVRVFAAKDGYRKASRVMAVEPDQTARVDFELQPIPEPLTGDLSGSVLEAESELPIVEAYVVLTPEEPLTYKMSCPLDTNRWVLTDKNGQFALQKIPAGIYRVTAIKNGFLPAVQKVLIEAGQVKVANFLLTRESVPEPGSLAGLVLDASTGQALAQAGVALFVNDQKWLTKHDDLVTTTDEQGQFLFPKLEVGRLWVSVTKPGYEPGLAMVTIQSGLKTECKFKLNPVANPGAIEGTVTDGVTGLPIADVLVFVPLVDQPFAANEMNAPHARTDADGKYRIENVPSGQRMAVAFLRDYFADAQLVNVPAGAAATLDFSLLRRPGESKAWRIRVLHARTGMPIAGVRIFVPVCDWLEPGCSWDPWSSQTDENGWATIKGVPRGDWSVVGSLARFKPVMTSLLDELATRHPSGFSQAGVETPTLTLMLEPLTDPNAVRMDWSIYE